MYDVFTQRTMELQNEVNRKRLNFELRDYIAIQAMQTLLKKDGRTIYGDFERISRDISKLSYEMADAMLAQRKK